MLLLEIATKAQNFLDNKCHLPYKAYGTRHTFSSTSNVDHVFQNTNFRTFFQT